jgi:choloylglycine hydrolase
MNGRVSQAFGIALLTAVFGANARACSTFLIRHERTLVVGHNLDEPGIEVWPGMVVVNKRGIHKQARTWREVGSDTVSSGRHRWVSKFGSITTNGFGRELPDGGMNEAGLVVCEMTLAETQFVEDDRLTQMFMMQWVQYLLDTCESVDQVIRSAQSVSLDGWNWHFFVADAKGEAAVIEFLDAKPVVFTRESMPVLVLCNAPYAKELTQLQEYEGFGGKKPIRLNGQDGLARTLVQGLAHLLGDNSISSTDRDLRFVHAAHMLKKYDSTRPPSEQAFSILKQMNKSGFTKWSVVYDIENRRIDFFTSAARTPRFCLMKSFDFSAEGPPLSADINVVASGDVHSMFRPCTTERNRDVVTKTVDAIIKLHRQESIALGTQGNVQTFTREQFLDRLATFADSVTQEASREK